MRDETRTGSEYSLRFAERKDPAEAERWLRYGSPDD